MADYSASVAEAAAVVDGSKNEDDIPEESLLQLKSSMSQLSKS